MNEFKFKANETKKDIVIKFPSTYHLRLINETYSELEFELVQIKNYHLTKLKHFFARLLLNIVSFIMREK